MKYLTVQKGQNTVHAIAMFTIAKYKDAGYGLGVIRAIPKKIRFEKVTLGSAQRIVREIDEARLRRQNTFDRFAGYEVPIGELLAQPGNMKSNAVQKKLIKEIRFLYDLAAAVRAWA